MQQKRERETNRQQGARNVSFFAFGKTHANKSGIEESRKTSMEEDKSNTTQEADYIKDDKREHEFAGGVK